ncbi:MAG TPA: hypothetical protein VM118_02160 [Acidobacteriota bacterium]|nr:hypothetical protein [Acidobacteriota bacterium]
MSPPKGTFRQWLTLVAATLIVVSLCQAATAQDTTIFVDLPDRAVYPGDPILIPVTLINLHDSIEAFSLTYVLGRPGLVVFADSLIVDTLIRCLDPPACADVDTTLDTLFASPAFRSGGTLTAEWDGLAGLVLSPTILRINGISDLNLDNLPPGIPPLTLGETLITIVAWALCDPDTISGFTVAVQQPTLAEFSNELGEMILPVSSSGATITILSPPLGDLDHSGVYDVLDVVWMINCAFRGHCPGCTNDLADLNCDEIVNVIDAVLLVNHVFRGGPVPGC